MIEKLGRWCLLGFIMLVLLAGCSKAQRDKAYYLNHPNQLATTLRACALMPTQQLIDDEQCQAAIEAQSIFRQYSQELEINQQQYGLKILHLQMQLGREQQALKQTELDDREQHQQLKQSIQQIQQEIATRLLLLRMTSRL